jgi:hypothetical protein
MNPPPSSFRNDLVESFRYYLNREVPALEIQNGRGINQILED